MRLEEEAAASVKEVRQLIVIVVVFIEFLLFTYRTQLSAAPVRYGGNIWLGCVTLALVLIPLLGLTLWIKVGGKAQIAALPPYQIPYDAKPTGAIWLGVIPGLWITILLFRMTWIKWPSLVSSGKVAQNISAIVLALILTWVLSAAITLYMASHHIVLESDRICFCKASSKHEVLYSHIRFVDVTKGVSAYGGVHFLEISREFPPEAALRFSLAFCSARDCGIIIDAIANKAPGVTLGPRATLYRQGFLPPMF